MIVFVNEQLDHQLKEPANFRNFSIEIAAPRDRLRELSGLLKDVVDFADESSAWLSASGLQAMSSLGEDATWRAELGRMIEKARPHGSIRDVPKLAIKAHIDWVGSGPSHQQP